MAIFAGWIGFARLGIFFDAAGLGDRTGRADAGADVRVAGVAGVAISIPNIADRSSLTSTFSPAGAVRGFERSEPALAISSSWRTLRSLNSNSGW